MVSSSGGGVESVGGGELLMLKPGIVGAAVYTGPPTTTGAGNGNTGARATVHTRSLV